MAVSIDAVGAGQTGTLSSFSYSHTFSGTRRHAIIAIMTAGSSASSVTIGSVSCSLIAGSFVGTGVHHVQLFEPDSEPATGAQTVSGTLSASQRTQVNSVSFNGVDIGGTPTAGLQTNTGNGNTTSVTVTTTADDFVLDGCRTRNDHAEQGTQTLQYHATSGSTRGGISTDVGVAGTVTMQSSGRCPSRSAIRARFGTCDWSADGQWHAVRFATYAG